MQLNQNIKKALPLLSAAIFGVLLTLVIIHYQNSSFEKNEKCNRHAILTKVYNDTKLEILNYQDVLHNIEQATDTAYIHYFKSHTTRYSWYEYDISTEQLQECIIELVKNHAPLDIIEMVNHCLSQLLALKINNEIMSKITNSKVYSENNEAILEQLYTSRETLSILKNDFQEALSLIEIELNKE